MVADGRNGQNERSSVQLSELILPKLSAVLGLWMVALYRLDSMSGRFKFCPFHGLSFNHYTWKSFVIVAVEHLSSWIPFPGFKE